LYRDSLKFTQFEFTKIVFIRVGFATALSWDDYKALAR